MRYIVWILLALGACTDGTDDGSADDDTVALPEDADRDGVPASQDCKDDDPEVFPGRPEVCDGKDNDCDGAVDDDDPDLVLSSAIEAFVDNDRDGVGADLLGFVCTLPVRASTQSGDCDDDDPTVFPGNLERCNGVDDNCDTLIDDEDPLLDDSTAETFFVDEDGDGFGDPDNQVRACEAPEDVPTVGNGNDCNDADAQAWTGAREICDSIDNDCNGATDDEDAGVDLTTARTFYVDSDLDDFGDASMPEQFCADPGPGHALAAGDCDDTRADVNPDAPEICDDRDNNCDAVTGFLVDDDDPDVIYLGEPFYYLDADRDGEGDSATAFQRCDPPAVAVLNDDDCDDDDPENFSANTEICDGGDNDCDGIIDDADPSLDATTATRWFVDGDGDGRGDPSLSTISCAMPPGAVTNDDDCNDAEPLAWSGADEVCDGVDNDCANGADDADPNLLRSSADLFWADADGDGFGDPATRVRACIQPPGTVENEGDCNDAEPLAWTNANEVCDGVDNDCQRGADDADPGLDQTSADIWYADRDGDGFGDPTTTSFACVQPPSSSPTAGDCNDREPRAWTGAPEVCDGVDNDCANGTDDADPNVDLGSAPSYYADTDADGFGDPAVSQSFCTPPANGVSLDNTDCDDTNAAVNPGAPEVCDGVDNDCDNDTDDDDADLDRSTGDRFWADTDGDGFGDPASSTRLCVLQPGVVDDATDCDDTNPLINPAATEVCDGGIDNDCANGADDADPNVDETTGTLVYLDADGDGVGDASTAGRFCEPPPGTATTAGDCDDDDGSVFPGAPEVCDGVDNDCANGTDDADPNLDPSSRDLFYTDNDGDGVGRGRVVARACVAPPGTSPDFGDCDDNDADNFPGNLEVCDGEDNDCDTLVDGTDVWWNAAWPYRVTVDVTAPAQDTVAPTAVVDVDFDALLRQLGDTSGLAADSVRVVHQDCAFGVPELVSEFADDARDVLGQDVGTDPADDAGAVVFLVDDDGDPTTQESVAAGSTRTYAIYFASMATGATVPNPGYPTDLSLSGLASGLPEVSNSRTVLALDDTQGGLAAVLASRGYPSIGGQTDLNAGNGLYVSDGAGNGNWLSARADANASLELRHRGPLFVTVSATGDVANTWGGFSYSYTYTMIAGRPEIYVAVSLVIDRPTRIGPIGSFWGTAVRPWYANNAPLAASVPSEGDAELPAHGWVRGAYDLVADPFGVAAGYRVPPALQSRPAFTVAGQFLGLVGQDVTDTLAGFGDTYDAAAGEVIVDDIVVVVYPHVGPWSAVEDAFFGTLDGTTVSLGTPDAL